MTNTKRRRLLQAALAAGGSSWLARAAAQGDRNLGISERRAPAWSGGGNPAALLIAKRRALVMGNAGYAFSPLRNPVNDARAISEALRATGFEVTTAIDFTREQMQNAMREYTGALAREKAVGVFYFAGHGVQLAWRNYLLPTDAKAERMEQIQATCIDVNSLIEGLAKAQNPMNVVILDACRDNPFGTDFRVEQKGLSQLDAPPGTLLAYATSPGNVASDGDGANGLYTEHLLKEIRVPEAKIEDVFKRVRLGVRRRSKGQQIPWESTSLEEDFWFLPPKELKRIAEAEREREYKQQLALFEKAQTANSVEAFEQYLRLHPSGYFSELAQFRLDRLLAQQGEKPVQVVSAPQNPYSQGTVRANTAFQVGDTYEYDVRDYFSKAHLRKTTTRVTRITETEVIFNDGALVIDLLGNPVRTPEGRRFSPNQLAPIEYVIGKRWTTRYSIVLPNGGVILAEARARIAAKERVTVPAGTFDAYRVEIYSTAWGPGGESVAENTLWIAPDRCRRIVQRTDLRRSADGRRVFHAERMELVSFREQR